MILLRKNSIFLFFLLPIAVYTQTYDIQILNKDATYAGVSNLQDYDGDGELDIIISQKNPSGLFWLENEPTQQFPKYPIITENISRITASFYLP